MLVCIFASQSYPSQVAPQCYVSNCNMRATKIIPFYYIIEKISLQNDTYAKNANNSSKNEHKSAVCTK